MKKAIHLLYLIPILLLNSCFVADNFFVEEKQAPPVEKSLQLKTEEAVQLHIKSELEGEKYVPYGFSALKIVKPIQLIELDSLENVSLQLPNDTVILNQISILKNEIRLNEITRQLKIDHFFTLQADSMQLTVIENQYRLNDTIAVISSNPKIILDLPLVYQEILNYYFNEYTIFISSSYTDSRRLSREFYAFFKKEIDRLSTIQEKSALLKNTLNLCLIVKKNGEFDQGLALKILYEDYIKNERTDISSFNPIYYSDLFETVNKDDNTTTGYYFFHTFSGVYNEVLDTNTVQINFNPYYQLVNITALDLPIEYYLNDTK